MPNYYKIYNDLCLTRKNENRTKLDNIYYEEHHIIPKCLGGNNSIDNLVLLTPREHFVAHLLLYKHYKKIGGEPLRKLAFALVSMTGNPTTKRIIRFSSKDYGVLREAAINATLGRKIEDTRNYRKPKSKSHKESIRNARLGMRWSKETRKKMKDSALRRGDNFSGNHTKSTCYNCGKSGQTNAMKRWHFDNCKEMINAQLA